MRSLGNKMDNLAALTKSQREYLENSVLCFTETWLHKDIPNSSVSVDTFQVVQVNRNYRESGKRKSRGLAILVAANGAILDIQYHG